MKIEYDKLCGMVYGRLTIIGFNGIINKNHTLYATAVVVIQ